MELVGFPLRQTFTINKLCSVHYFEFSKDYVFPGERHDFWEMVYVDKGEILATAGDREFPLYCGQLLFHQPDEWHNIRANGAVAPNVMIVSFSSKSAAMRRFAGKTMTLNSAEKQILSSVLSESRRMFDSPLDDPFNHTLKISANAPLGGEQQLGCDLIQLLISLARRLVERDHTEHKLGSTTLLDEIRHYMETHLSQKLTLEHLATEFHISQSYLKKLFSEYTGSGAIHYFLQLRTEMAKKLLRESEKNISQIAEGLGYDNVYYFSNQFRRITGMSPLEYRRSVKALDERVRSKQ